MQEKLLDKYMFLRNDSKELIEKYLQNFKLLKNAKPSDFGFIMPNTEPYNRLGVKTLGHNR